MSTSQIKKALKELCNKYGVAIMYVFGSRAQEIRNAVARGGEIDSTNSSDIDIAVKMLDGVMLQIRQKIEFAIDLEDLFGVGNVDPGLLTEADPFLAVNIIRGERLYCVDEKEADEYELYILRRAGDLAPFERHRIRNILKPVR